MCFDLFSLSSPKYLEVAGLTKTVHFTIWKTNVLTLDSQAAGERWTTYTQMYRHIGGGAQKR